MVDLFFRFWPAWWYGFWMCFGALLPLLPVVGVILYLFTLLCRRLYAVYLLLRYHRSAVHDLSETGG